ncbi:TauD/TfdA family dioxygenase [Vibrio tubiashii]|uniref:TauD/TfdA family dioxygenase n=1 Tax=Vibrio tubiashii TaxID=29498 RepID=A0AAE5GQJ4_9VIBR|nr:TauD/TfdA family dioxygenase [Vibrio tubiashii]
MNRLKGLNWKGVELREVEDWILTIKDDKDGFSSLKYHKKYIDDVLKDRGFILIKGLPVDRVCLNQCEKEMLNVGFLFGAPVSQSNKFDFIGHVTDKHSDISQPTQRGYESRAALPFHSDRCDLLALLCIHPARHGGETRLVSAVSAFEQLQRSHPNLARLLTQPYPFDKRDDAQEGERGWTMLAPFSSSNGNFVSRYVRRFIEGSQRFPDAPRLTADQRQAMNMLDRYLEQKGQSLDLSLETGDLLLMDNHRLLHARSEFTDTSSTAEDKRLLLRLWLAYESSPALPTTYQETYGRVEGGTYRGGVWPRAFPLSNVPANMVDARCLMEEQLQGGGIAEGEQ